MGKIGTFTQVLQKKTTGNEIQTGEDTFCDATALALAALRTRHNYFHGAVDFRGRVPRHTPNCKNVLAARPRTNSNASLENLAPAKIASGKLGLRTAVAPFSSPGFSVRSAREAWQP